MRRPYDITMNDARRLARHFKRHYVDRNCQWDTDTIVGFLPSTLLLRDGAVFHGKATVEEIAKFLHRECIER